MFHDRNKHINVQYRFIREIISKGILKIGKIATLFNSSDMGTKGISLSQFNYFLKLLFVDSLN